MYKKLLSITIVMLIVIVGILSGCSKKESDDNKIPDDAKNPVAMIEMEDGGKMTIELYYNIAPNTVLNFISLANSGYYDELIFHRVIPGFMIQGGCPQGTGTGNPGYSIKGEFSKNNFENSLDHERGVISMARGKSNDSAGSQFFIVHKNSPHLNGDYAAFGKVTDGMDVVDAIAAEATSKDKPLEDVVIKSIRVETYNIDYPEPETIK